MASEKRKGGSRANRAKSPGSVASEGKLRSPRSSFDRFNAERGMLTRPVVLEGESRPRVNALITSLQEESKAETTTENLLT